MHVDRYTKTMLTVIAGCLLWMCLRDAGPVLHAQRDRDRDRPPDTTQVDLREIKTSAQPVILVGTGTMDRQGRIEVTFNQQGRSRTDPTLSVQLPYSPANPMAVEISAVKKTGDWDSLRTAVDDAPLRSKPGHGGQ